MSKPPKIVIPGLNRGAGVPGGYVLGRRNGHGPVELLGLAQLRGIGLATEYGVVTSISSVTSTAVSLVTSLSSVVGGAFAFDGGTAALGGRGFVLDGGTSAVRSDLDFWVDGGTA